MKFKLFRDMVLVTAMTAIAGCGRANVPTAPLSASAQASSDMAAESLLDPGQASAPLGPMPGPANRPGQWLLFANHEHTQFSPDADESPANLIGLLHNAGVDAMDITDHNSMGAIGTPAFQTSPLIMVKGMEWGALRQNGETVEGHAGLLNMDGTDPLPTNATLDEMLAMATARHAYIIANHPFCHGNAWASRPLLQPQVSAIEVWNGFWMLATPIMHNDQALAWWDSLIKTGRHLTAIGGADYHGVWWKHFPSIPGSEPMRPVNLLFASSRTPEGVLDGVRGGHITIEATNQAARVVLEADPTHDGSWSAIEGDDVTIPQIETIPMRAHVLGGKGLTVTFIGKGGAIGSHVVQSDDEEVPVTVPAVPGVYDYVRVELQAHAGKWWSMTALTNPIYLN